MSEPSHLGRNYEIEGKISEGTFGVVLKVRDVDTGEIAVAKVFEEEEWVSLSDDEEETTMSQTALREISFLHLLKRHRAPRTAEVLDFAFSLGEYVAPVVYMPLYCGDLSDAISEERLDPHQRFLIACDVMSALAFLHAASPPIVHRDVKPENVFLDAQERGVLGDLGFACFVDPLRQKDPEKCGRKRRRGGRRSSSTHASNSGVLGTVTYISPEAFQGAYPDASADVWAAGVMLLEAKENRRLDADTDEEAFKVIRAKKKRMDEGFLLERMLKAMLEWKPRRRTTAAFVLASLRVVGLLETVSVPMAPRFAAPVAGEVDAETAELCRQLKAVVPETFSAARSYGRFAPDMDPRVLAVVAAKVHEHRPLSDERMTELLELSVEALEEAQEELLRRTHGCLLAQSFGEVKA
jgi:serine/threonine protein kinase